MPVTISGNGALAGVNPVTSGFGKVLQVVQGTANTALTTTNTSYQTSGLTASITPSSTSNKILIFVNIPVTKVTDNIFSGCQVGLFRGTVAGTLLVQSDNYAAGANFTTTANHVFLDSPNTTSSQTYTVGYKTASGLTTVGVMPGGNTATLTLIEVAS